MDITVYFADGSTKLFSGTSSIVETQDYLEFKIVDQQVGTKRHRFSNAALVGYVVLEPAV